jgi:predicted nucleotidyltransferase
MNLEEALQALLGVSVDVVSVGGLKDRDEHIRRDAVPL